MPFLEKKSIFTKPAIRPVFPNPVTLYCVDSVAMPDIIEAIGIYIFFKWRKTSTEKFLLVNEKKEM